MNIVITGASRGIGYETAKLFSKNSRHRILALSRNKDRLIGLENVCRELNPDAEVNILSFDIAAGDISSNLIPEIIRHVNPVDILINNAGSMINKPFEALNEEDFDRIFQTNVKAVFRITKSLLPYFSSQAHIVNLGSMGGFQGSQKFAGLSLYSASKGALAILTECLAEEFKDRDIRTNCLAIGAVQTAMLAEAFPGYKAPLTDLEMAAFICDFAENGHRYFNGKILPVALSTP